MKTSSGRKRDIGRRQRGESVNNGRRDPRPGAEKTYSSPWDEHTWAGYPWAKSAHWVRSENRGASFFCEFFAKIAQPKNTRSTSRIREASATDKGSNHRAQITSKRKRGQSEEAPPKRETEHPLLKKKSAGREQEGVRESSEAGPKRANVIMQRL